MKKTQQKIGGVLIPLLSILLLSQLSFADNKQMNSKTQIESEDISTHQWHIGVGFNMTTVSDSKCEDITYGVVGKVGYDFSKYIGVEGRFIKTNWEYEGAKVEHMGLFMKPMLPINDNVDMYGLIGYGETSTSSRKVFSDSGIAWGLGLNYYFDRDSSETLDKEDENRSQEVGKGLGLFVDYENLLEKSDVPNFDSFSVGITYSF